MANGKLLNVYVGLRDIRNGEVRDCEYCPVALAIRRRLRDGVCVRVSPDEIVLEYLNNAGDRMISYYDPTPAVINAIENYDEYGRMSPFSFRLRVDEVYL